MFRVNALLRREGLRGSSPGASDATAFLTIYILLTCALPSNLVISSLGSIGRPSNLFALAGFGWWVLHQFTRVTPTTTRRHPLRVALTVFLLVALASYAFAMLRGLPDTEASPADAVVWYECSYGESAASSCCPAIAFFCSQDHLEVWQTQNPSAIGLQLAINEALEVGRAIFSPVLRTSDGA